MWCEQYNVSSTWMLFCERRFCSALWGWTSSQAEVRKHLLLTTFNPDAFMNVSFLMSSSLTTPPVLSQVQKSKRETRSEVTGSYWEQLEVCCHFVLNGENPIFHLAENKALPDWLHAEKQAFGLQTFSVLTHTQSGFYAPFHFYIGNFLILFLALHPSNWGRVLPVDPLTTQGIHRYLLRSWELEFQ